LRGFLARHEQAGRHFRKRTCPFGTPFAYSSVRRFHEILTAETQGRISPMAPSGDRAMYHTIKFASECLVDLEMSSRQPLERVLIRPGTGLRAQLRPYVLETNDGPIEVADLFFEDDTAIRSVPFACFSFVD
jgi:hypothetical protein